MYINAMNTFLKNVLLGCAVLIAAFVSFQAQAKELKNKEKYIKQVEDYFAGLTTARSRFVQTTHDGTQLLGTFYLDRPGKLRFEYDPPIEDFIVADGLLIYFYDGELKEQSHAPIGQTLADFILRDDLTLDDEEITVKSVKRAGGFLQLDLIQAEDPEAGSLMLAFQENPLQLKKWRVVDAQGFITETELFYMETDVEHESNLFGYADPERGTDRYND